MPKKLHSQPHRGQLQSLCAVSSCFQKTRAFLDVLSDLYQADASHKVPRRSGNTQMLLDLVLRSEMGLEACSVYPHFLFGVCWYQNRAKFKVYGEVTDSFPYHKGRWFIAVSCWPEHFCDTWDPCIQKCFLHIVSLLLDVCLLYLFTCSFIRGLFIQINHSSGQKIITSLVTLPLLSKS